MLQDIKLKPYINFSGNKINHIITLNKTIRQS
jgi:hypothetical protein